MGSRIKSSCADMRRLGTVMLVVAMLAAFAPIALAHHVSREDVAKYGCIECPPTGSTNCYCVDPGGCHYTCVGVPLSTMPPLPTTGGKELQEAISAVGDNVFEAEKLRKALKADPDLEGTLENYYKEVLKVEPDNFWANWDYARLKINQKDFDSADGLLNKASTKLDPGTREIVIGNIRKDIQDKWEQDMQATLPSGTTYTPSPLSKFVSRVTDEVRDAVKKRTEPSADENSEKLTMRAKIVGNAVGLYGDKEQYKSCVTGGQSIGYCVSESLTRKAALD